MASAYETLRVIGRGSHGTAMLVRDRRKPSAELQVLKEVDISQMQPDACEQARKEVEVLRSLQHVNIVAYYSTFLDLGRLYIVMEYADGGNLADAIKKRQTGKLEKFSEDEGLSLFSQACLALQHMHSKHILHRDLKSQNIFLTKEGAVKLGDFGIAKMLDHSAAEACTVIGTPSYLAPEVCDSQPYGTKADVWSIGVVLHEILTLDLPFKAKSLAALVVKIVTSKLPPVLPDVCSLEARVLVKNMLRKKPERRPSVDEILALPIIQHAVAHLPQVPHLDDSEPSTRATSRTSSSDSSSSRERVRCAPTPARSGSKSGEDATRSDRDLKSVEERVSCSGAYPKKRPTKIVENSTLPSDGSDGRDSCEEQLESHAKPANLEVTSLPTSPHPAEQDLSSPHHQRRKRSFQAKMYGILGVFSGHAVDTGENQSQKAVHDSKDSSGKERQAPLACRQPSIRSRPVSPRFGRSDTNVSTFPPSEEPQPPSYPCDAPCRTISSSSPSCMERRSTSDRHHGCAPRRLSPLSDPPKFQNNEVPQTTDEASQVRVPRRTAKPGKPSTRPPKRLSSLPDPPVCEKVDVKRPASTPPVTTAPRAGASLEQMYFSSQGMKWSKNRSQHEALSVQNMRVSPSPKRSPINA